MAFIGFELNEDFGLQYEKQTDTWIGEVKTDDQYEDYYHFFIIKGDDIQFYTYNYEEKENIAEDFNLKNEKEGEVILEQMSEKLKEILFMKPTDFFINKLLSYINSLKELKKDKIETKINIIYRDNNYIEIEIKGYPFFIVQREKNSFAFFVKNEDVPYLNMTDWDLPLHKAEEYLGEKFIEKIQKAIKKQLK